jgi:hypothetical protein
VICLIAATATLAVFAIAWGRLRARLRGANRALLTLFWTLVADGDNPLRWQCDCQPADDEPCPRCRLNGTVLETDRSAQSTLDDGEWERAGLRVTLEFSGPIKARADVESVLRAAGFERSDEDA